MPKTDTALDKKLPKDPAAHSIWLAGLGALAAAEEEGPRLFSRLVELGRNRVKIIKAASEDWDKVTVTITQGVSEIHLGPDVELTSLASLFEEVTSSAPSAAEVANLRRNAQARKAFLAEFGTLTSREVAELAGSSASNRAALANRWKAEGRIFAVEMGGQTLFPAFQFSDDDGQPRPVIAEILEILQPKLSGGRQRSGLPAATDGSVRSGPWMSLHPTPTPRRRRRARRPRRSTSL
jgi:hypothetical protein